MHDDELVVRIHMEPGNMITVPAFIDRNRMKVQLFREQRFRLITPFRNVEERQPDPFASVSTWLKIITSLLR
jgi:hypothetical protein